MKAVLRSPAIPAILHVKSLAGDEGGQVLFDGESGKLAAGRCQVVLQMERIVVGLFPSG